MIGWSESLRLGVKRLDDQHIAIFDACKKIRAAAQAQRSGETDESLDFLLRYALDHFIGEERLMQAVRYPRFADHQHEHALYGPKLVAAVEKARADGSALSALADSVENWLAFHINQEDRALAEYLRAKGALLPPDE